MEALQTDQVLLELLLEELVVAEAKTMQAELVLEVKLELRSPAHPLEQYPQVLTKL
jgi:hypothetical protein